MRIVRLISVLAILIVLMQPLTASKETLEKPETLLQECQKRFKQCISLLKQANDDRDKLINEIEKLKKENIELLNKLKSKNNDIIETSCKNYWFGIAILANYNRILTMTLTADFNFYDRFFIIGQIGFNDNIFAGGGIGMRF